jgi:hypothetical protein
MAKRKSTRVTQRILAKDVTVARAVLSLAGYNPSNNEFTADKLKSALDAFATASEIEQQAADSLAKAREATVDVEWTLHELVLGVKRQVIAQYGDDSDEIAALGLKKKSERRYGRPKKQSPPTP